ncbi:MAG: hypothetical protein ACYDHZ_06135 [Dehalococcoidia bacterium]
MVMNSAWENALHFGPSGTSFIDYWTGRLVPQRNILIITGLGWDPRLSSLPRTLEKLGGSGLRDLHLICFKPSASFKSPHQDFLDKNEQTLVKIAKKWGKIVKIEVITRRDGNVYCGDDVISRIYLKCALENYDDVIVDISALPKSLYFTLLLILVKRHYKEYPKMNVHVVACQDVNLDSQITESADYIRPLKGFKSNFARTSQQQIPRIWVPVLERNNRISIQKIYDYMLPKDVYPVMPFPSKNPRTDDDLLVEYRSIFVDEWNLNPMNIIYALEDDPLDVYRIVISLFQNQKETLMPLGGISMAVSALSSKLSSIGVFMAAYEGNLAVIHSIGRHDPPASLKESSFWDDKAAKRFQDNLHSIWLTGEPYE